MELMIRLDVHGVGVEIAGEGPFCEETLAALAEDFAYFSSSANPGSAQAGARPPAIRVRCSGRAWDGSPPTRSLRLFRTRLCEVRQAGLGSRWCGYGGGHAVEARDARGGEPRLFTVHAATAAAEYELAYLALLSAIGEELDSLGLHRVHALGIERDGQAALVLLPSGGGKSAMALLGTRSGLFRVYSDESPLVRGGCLHPCPVRPALAPLAAAGLRIEGSWRLFGRLAFPPKRLYRWQPAWIAREPRKVSRVFVGYRGESAQVVDRISALGAASALTEYLVVGRGIAQMAEHMLRPLAAARLARIAASRAAEAVRLARGAELASFRVGADARANLEALEGALGAPARGLASLRR